MQAQDRPVGVAYGECWCGCGARTNIVPGTCRSRGLIKGEPYRYLVGHARRKSPVLFIVKDCGYRTPCHIWQRMVDQLGYGRVQILTPTRTTQVAHRWFYEQAHGPVPHGYELDHRCRQRSCVRVDHLEVVTHTQNMRRSSWTKLTAEDVAVIRATARVRGSGVALAARFGVTPANISAIRNGKTWA